MHFILAYRSIQCRQIDQRQSREKQKYIDPTVQAYINMADFSSLSTWGIQNGHSGELFRITL